MGKEIIATGHVTILHQKDAYTISQSIREYIFNANPDGSVTEKNSFTSIITVTQGDKLVTDFKIGSITAPSGFTSVAIDNSKKTITYTVNANSKIANSGKIDIPVIVNGVTYPHSFVWSKAIKGNTGNQGAQGIPGTDANLLDWVQDWNSGKTQINSDTVITPKLFAGVKNSNQTVTGTAIGRFNLTTRNDKGEVITERIDGVYGFKDGFKTFSIDNKGNVQFGCDKQSIQYDSESGKVIFGSDVSLNWIDASDQAKDDAIKEAASDATKKATQAKTDAISAAASDATTKANQAKTDAISNTTTQIGKLESKLNTEISAAKEVGTKAQATADAITNKAKAEEWDKRLTHISSTGIFTGTLSANIVEALNIKASQITAGTIDVARINVDALKSSLITTENIEALELNVVKGKIGGWSIDSSSLYRGTKNNTSGTYTSASGALTIGSNGIRGNKWRLDSTGAGALAGGNISWDNTGKVTFASDVSLQWINYANEQCGKAKSEAINAAAVDATQKANQAKSDAISTSEGKINSIKIGGRNLIPNTNKGLRGWSHSKKDGEHKIEAVTALGVNAVKVTTTAPSSSWNVVMHTIKRALIENKVEYTFSVDVYCEYDTTLNATLRAGDGKNLLISWGSKTISKDTWIKVVLTATSTDNEETDQQIYITGFNKVGSTTFANLKVEEGNKVSTWSPAPEDVGSDISTAKADAINSANSNTSIQVGNLETKLNKNISEAKKAGTDAQATADAINKKAKDENWDTKLTFIDANGIYTGALSANIVEALNINAGQITAGTIDAARINVEALKASLITAGNINALELNVVKGKIGGWSISTSTIRSAVGSKYFIIHSAENDSAAGSNRGHRGITIYNDDGNVADDRVKIIQMGALADRNTVQNYATETNYGFRIAIKGGKDLFRVDKDGAHISNWNFDTDSIYRGTKNNTSGGFTSASGGITIGSNGLRGHKWRLDSTGAGALAAGNISWDANGKVTFGKDVSVEWIGYTDQKVNSLATGGRNYAQKTSNEWSSFFTLTDKENNCGLSYKILADQWEVNDEITISFDYYFENIVKTGTGTARVTFQAGGDVTAWSPSLPSHPFVDKIDFGKKTGMVKVCYTLKVDSSRAVNNVFNANIRHDYLTGKVRIRNLMVEKGNKKTDWSPAPEDVNTQIGDVKKVADSTVTALGGSNYPKMTKIDANGVYTGTLTATQVNAVSINASSIKTGTLSVDRLDAAKIKSNIINTDYINGLSCKFTKGTVGGWSIGTDHITHGSVGANGATPIQIRTTSTGSGYWYSGAYKPKGITLTWHQSSNAGHIVFGQVASTGNAPRTNFYGIQMMAWDNTEYFCLSANAAKTGGKEIYNRIAGWAFDNDSIYRGTKNNSAGAYTTTSGHITIGSNGIRGYRWCLDSNGNAQLGTGNQFIKYNASSGKIEFGSEVTMSWAASAAQGRMIYRDPEFFNGNNSIGVYNNSGNGTVTVTRASDSSAPNQSKYVLVIKNAGTATPNCGGFCWAHATSNGKIYVTRFIAKIPTGRSVVFNTNSLGTGGKSEWLTPVAGTGKWQEYVIKITIGTSPSTTNFFSLTGALGTTTAPVEWRLAYATVFDNTSSEKYTTTIDANGIYTGKLSAGQVEALTCNFTKGKVGGWSIGSNYISSDTSFSTSDTSVPIQIYTVNSGSGNIYGGGRKLKGVSLSWHRGGNAGHLVFGQVMTNATTVKSGFYGIQMMDHSNQEYFCLAANTSKEGSREIYNRIAGWAFDNSKIWSGDVSLNKDGTIECTGKWQLKKDGAGYVAKGNINWNAAGSITIKNAAMQNVTITGTIRNAFVKYDSSIWIDLGSGTTGASQQNFEKHDNIVFVNEPGGWSTDPPKVPWTLNQSGRRLTILNYKWGSNETGGYVEMSAPSGKYFYEDGTRKNKLRFSRELIELLGYGDNSTFFGWIVVNRRDLMTTKQYGMFTQYLAMGTVTVSSGKVPSIKYKTYTGGTMSVSRSGTGLYNVYLPWSLGAENYMVLLSGIWSASDNTPIYGTLRNKYSSSFQVRTQDDASANDGSFSFMVVSMGDFTG